MQVGTETIIRYTFFLDLDERFYAVEIRTEILESVKFSA